jgi:arogenate dehydrogenase (NADP+)
MVEMTCEEHDRQAASTQFVTHTVGRMLGAMDLASTDINTKGYENLLQLVNNTKNDSFELYYGLFLYNTNATGEETTLFVGHLIYSGTLDN